jgi:hypothetical protein
MILLGRFQKIDPPCLIPPITRILPIMPAVLLFSLSVSAADQPGSKNSAEKEPAVKELSLFDGKSLDGWKITEFGGQGDVHAKDGRLVIEMGVDLSGVTWKDAKKLPRSNYEVTLDAMRVDGNDFFCGLTFPVKDDPCSLIIGGWAGGVCGLSSIDGMDASENETTTYRTFKKGQWYRIRLRVTDDKIEAWIDDEQIVDQDLQGRKVSIRREVELSRPLGFSTWQTTAALRNIRLRELPRSAEAPRP